MSNNCACGAAPKFVFSCSGAADVGEVADRAARRLGREGELKMFCLAGVGGRVSGIVKSAEAASLIVAIDGCPLNCAAKTLEQAGLSNFKHVRLSDIGLEKGEASPTDKNIDRVVQAVNQITG